MKKSLPILAILITSLCISACGKTPTNTESLNQTGAVSTGVETPITEPQNTESGSKEVPTNIKTQAVAPTLDN